MRWRYLYPQSAFPYQDLIEENRRRARKAPEYELVDTGIFDGDRYFEMTRPTTRKRPRTRSTSGCGSAMRGPEEAGIDVLPTLWFRNTWAWDSRGGRG